MNDISDLLEGDYQDGRRLVVFKDLDDVKAKAAALRRIISQWLASVKM